MSDLTAVVLLVVATVLIYAVLALGLREAGRRAGTRPTTATADLGEHADPFASPPSSSEAARGNMTSRGELR